MRRWLAVLKECEISSGISSEDMESSDETRKSPRRQSKVLFYDSDMGGEPMTFRDVFFYSQALEGISVCMILEALNEDELSLLLELFGLCLTEGKALHYTIVSSIQDLAKVFSGYQDEVLVKKEELIQFAKGAITGLKVNVDMQRIDAEVSMLKKQFDELGVSHIHVGDSHEANIKEKTVPSIEALKEALARIRVCSKIEGLLLKKKAIKYGDTTEIHAQKVDKLKVLSESLVSSSSKAEKRISDHRVQKEEALKFRVSKASEVSEVEKEVAADVSALEKQRDELEAELLKVNISLSAARARLHNVTEERDQFFEANDQIIAHLKTKEDELSQSIGSCKVEADVLSTWINFLEDTWSLQSSHVETKEKETSAELEGHESYFTDLVVQLLSSYEKGLRPAIDRIEKYVENLMSLNDRLAQNADIGKDESEILNPKKNLEEEYLDYEAKIITTFSVVDNMREHFNVQHGKMPRKESSKVNDLFDNIEKLRKEFETVERPTLEIEIVPTKETDVSFGEKLQSPKNTTENAPKEHEVAKHVDPPMPAKSEQMLDPESELAKLESEFGKVSQDYSTEEIGEWEFDELERELISGGSSKK